MDSLFESGIDWDSGPEAIKQLYAGFFLPDSNNLWKLVDIEGKNISLTRYQRVHIKEWSRDVFIPLDGGKWKINSNNYADDGRTSVGKTPVPAKAEVGYKLLLKIDYHGDARLWDTIEFICVKEGVWQAKEFWKTLSKEEEEEDAERKAQWKKSPEYFKRLEESSRYDGNDRLGDGYSNVDDDEDNIMRGLKSGNGDRIGF